MKMYTEKCHTASECVRMLICFKFVKNYSAKFGYPLDDVMVISLGDLVRMHVFVCVCVLFSF